MKSCEVKLSAFSAKYFDKGAGLFKRVLWFLVNTLFVRGTWNPCMGVKIWLLRIFGARIGKGLVIKNGVNIKFPWKLEIGNNVWLGESCWIDNLDKVFIGNNVCISQGALLLTGNHDYTLPTFDYRNAPIVVEDGAWVGAKSVVCPGVTISNHSILTVGTIVTKNTEAYGIYQGNPAVKIRIRSFRE